MAPTSLHALFPRDHPSLAQLFHDFPAKVWFLIKLLILGLAFMLALSAIVFGVFYIVSNICIHAPVAVKWLRSGKWREVVERCGEKVGQLRRIERVDWLCKWFECGSVRAEAEGFDVEELEHLGSCDGEGREGSFGGETLFDGEESEDGDGRAMKKKEMELHSEDYIEGKP